MRSRATARIGLHLGAVELVTPLTFLAIVWVTFWGTLAMAITAGIGELLGTMA